MDKIRFLKCRQDGSTYIQMNQTKNQGINDVLEDLIANTVEASIEKHIPSISFTGTELKVNIGKEPHPMTKEHYIVWIFVETKNGGMLHNFEPGCKPEATFNVDKGDVISVNAYCNIHGLWKLDVVDEFKFSETVCSAEFSDGCK